MNNAQLIKTLAKKRTANFREDETRLLISLWGSPQIQNKLNLTHRKAPVMRLIAANMQQRGFYRSPDEIKTRIRNLKCLYHRIKRTITSGSGIGTVDPDWPHFKAMDAILGDSSSTAGKVSNSSSNSIKPDIDAGPDTHFEIKQELDINDDLESWNGNESVGSEYDDDLTPASLPEPAITITTTPVKPPNAINNNPNQSKNNMGQATNQLSSQVQVPRTITCTPQTTIRPAGQAPNLTLPPSIPLPFLILNNLKPAQNALSNQINLNNMNSDGGPPSKRKKDGSDDHGYEQSLQKLIDIQKQMLEVDKERLDVEKQRLEFDRLVGSQLMTLVPMMASVVQRLIFPSNDLINKSFDMDAPPESTTPIDAVDDDVQEIPEPPVIEQPTIERNVDDELEKNRNILRNLLNEGLKARMLEQSRKQQQEDERLAEKNARETDNERRDNIEARDDHEQKNDEGGKDKDQPDVDDNEENETNENDDNESCVLLINEENSVGAVEENN